MFILLMCLNESAEVLLSNCPKMLFNVASPGPALVIFLFRSLSTRDISTERLASLSETYIIYFTKNV